MCDWVIMKLNVLHKYKDTHTACYLRTELVLTFHNTSRFFPSRNTTSLSVTSSRLGTSSVGPVFSTCFKESDLERDNYSRLENNLGRWMKNVWGEKSSSVETSCVFRFSLVDCDEAGGCIRLALPVFVLAEAGLHPWFSLGSNPPQRQAVQARVWQSKRKVPY